jgi:predicted HTH transcriptional regulator
MFVSELTSLIQRGKQFTRGAVHRRDSSTLIESGLEEHLQLECKSALYEDNDRGRREFLLDTCMFANSSGGILLIGVPERRDEQGQPTGAPDPAGMLGLEVPNPEAVLNAYVMEAIEERLPLEVTAVDLGQGRRVLAIRVFQQCQKATFKASRAYLFSGTPRASAVPSDGS